MSGGIGGVSISTVRTCRLSGIISNMARIAKVLIHMGRDDPIFIFSHIDADGICSAAIIIELLIEMNKPFVLNFFPQISVESFREFWQEVEPRYAIFLDLGTDAPLEYIEKTPSVSLGIVIDHHVFSIRNSYSKSLVINPRFWGLDGGVEISSAGMTFLLANTISNFFANNPISLFCAVVGALGDAQDIGAKRSLLGLNRSIVEYGKRHGILCSYEDYILIGRGFKPLYRLLAEMFIFEIPGVSGSYDGAIDFLIRIGIMSHDDDPEKIFWEKLTPEQKDVLRRKLLEALVLKYSGKYSIEELNNILRGYVYEFLADKEFFCRYARDMSILLNACGKMRAPEIAIKGLLNPSDQSAVQRIFQLYERYRAILSSVFSNLDTKIDLMGEVAIYDGRDEIHEELTSTISSILASSLKDRAKVVIAIARSIEGTLKISLRKTNLLEKSLTDILKKISEKMPNIVGGGHESAAGAYIPEESLDLFLSILSKEILS